MEQNQTRRLAQLVEGMDAYLNVSEEGSAASSARSHSLQAEPGSASKKAAEVKGTVTDLKVKGGVYSGELPDPPTLHASLSNLIFTNHVNSGWVIHGRTGSLKLEHDAIEGMDNFVVLVAIVGQRQDESGTTQ